MGSPTIESNEPTIYIVYNAKSTLLGKMSYVYRKTTCPDPGMNPACAACELTHGPSLSLHESSQWQQTKACISNANIVQVHLDGRPGPLFQWMKQHSIRSPAVILKPVTQSDQVEGESYKILLTAEDLARVRDNHEMFLRTLKSRIDESGPSSIKVNVP